MAVSYILQTLSMSHESRFLFRGDPYAVMNGHKEEDGDHRKQTETPEFS